MYKAPLILKVQTLYILVTACWPLVHIHSFLLVTGYKKELWLVKAFSLLLISIAVSFIYAIVRKEHSPVVSLLAIAQALALLIIDLYYPLKGTISPVYLADGLVQLVFVCWWIYVLLEVRR